MYKILIKTKSSSKDYYTPYMIDEITESSITSKEYETESLEELAATYKDLLKSYTLEQLKPIHELDTEILIEINE